MRAHQGGTPPTPNILPLRSDGLIDNHGRRITYLRLAITDRCNLRCHYCRPPEGVPFVPHAEILRLEELERLVAIFGALGISKIRVTGGEPFSRRGCLPFLGRLRQIAGVKHLHITTNGVTTSRHLDELAALAIDGINLSLDTLDPNRFRSITRRDSLEPVLETLHGLLARAIPLKINSVVLADTSDAELIGLATLAREHPVTLRFIERMPFSGAVRSEKIVNGDLSQRLLRLFPALQECNAPQPTTARLFSLPGYAGKLGVIAGHSRLFCATCNKLRVTPIGILKTCLYDEGALDLRALLRDGSTDREIRAAIVSCVQNRFANGHEAERLSGREIETSMGMIGG
jgi:cyclic pyranopterin phosphate synthase